MDGRRRPRSRDASTAQAQPRRRRHAEPCDRHRRAGALRQRARAGDHGRRRLLQRGRRGATGEDSRLWPCEDDLGHDGSGQGRGSCRGRRPADDGPGRLLRGRPRPLRRARGADGRRCAKRAPSPGALAARGCRGGCACRRTRARASGSCPRGRRRRDLPRRPAGSRPAVERRRRARHRALGRPGPGAEARGRRPGHGRARRPCRGRRPGRDGQTVDASRRARRP